jgi:ribosomal protein S18 acetylase RimI-like enzyme
VTISTDGWLAGMMERPVFRVEAAEAAGAAAAWALREEVAAHVAARHVPAFYFAKVETAAVESVRALGSIGFYVVDVNVTLGMDGGRALTAPPTAGTVVDTCRPEDVDAVLDIASSAYRYSRFHQDPQVPAETAHRIKRDWVGNYVRGARGERLMVARQDGRVVGFLAVIGSGAPDARVRTIDLIAVDPAAQGRGAGRALVGAFLEYYAPTSLRLSVGTQVANVPSLRLYESLGFRVSHSAYVMHLHTTGSETPQA